MRVHSLRRFPYAFGNAWCDVDVYQAKSAVLVVLRDQDDHLGPSLTNQLEEVAREVREEVLEPLGLSRLHIPSHFEQLFQSKVGTHSKVRWAAIPRKLSTPA